MEVRKFHPEQLAGLNEIGWTFNMEARPVSIKGLCQDEATSPFFDSITKVGGRMSFATPIPREVAVNPNQPALRLCDIRYSIPPSISFYDQLEMIDKVVGQLIPNFRSYALEEFVDPMRYQTMFVATVGRVESCDPLRVLGINTFPSHSHIQAILVATPSGNK